MMHELPFRTNTTFLTDDELILLDVLFDGAKWKNCLYREVFREQWNLGYSHNLNDDELGSHLRSLCEHGVLESEFDDNGQCFRITVFGGELWSQERLPVWDRFCHDCYTTTSRGRTMMSVVAVSPRIRDEFLDLFPMYPARRRIATIERHVLISWHPFSKLYVGSATYIEQREWHSIEEYNAYKTMFREHWELLKQKRSWWRTVGELQRFVPHNGKESSGSTQMAD